MRDLRRRNCIRLAAGRPRSTLLQLFVRVLGTSGTILLLRLTAVMVTILAANIVVKIVARLPAAVDGAIAAVVALTWSWWLAAKQHQA